MSEETLVSPNSASDRSANGWIQPPPAPSRLEQPPVAQTSVADQQVGAELRGESLPQQGQRALPVPGHVQRACSSCNFGTKKTDMIVVTKNQRWRTPSPQLGRRLTCLSSATRLSLLLWFSCRWQMELLFFYGMFFSLDLDLYLYRVLYTGCFQVVSVSEY